MHLLRSIIALATLLAPLAIAALTLGSAIHEDDVQRFHRLMKRVEDNGEQYETVYRDDRELVIIYVEKNGKITTYQVFRASKNAPAFFRMHPTDGGKRPQKGRKVGKGRKVVTSQSLGSRGLE